MRSTDFSKALVLTIAIVIPITAFSNIGNLEIGISIAMGCLLSSPSDVTGSFKHKVFGILAAATLGSISYIIARYLSINIFTTIPMLAGMMFCVSYLSVYGFRASLVTFSGLLAVVLSFAGISSVIEIWQKGLLIFGGGMWYLLISCIWYLISPKRATEQLIGETMEITAAYLRTRVRMLNPKEDYKNLQDELLKLQNELNDHHESLREILIQSRKSFGNSGYSRKRLLIFIDLVDILELAMANPIDYESMQRHLGENQEVLWKFSGFSIKMASHLEKIAFAIHRNSRMPENMISESVGELGETLLNFRRNIKLTQDREAMLLLRNLYDYQVKQAQKINNIDRILRDLETKTNILYKEKEVQRFLTPQEYSFKMLATNLNLDSAIFRHSLRLAMVVVIGYLIGSYFSVQNAYWILLTIVVIMRPNYGLTKERTRKRIVGTLIGGGIAVGIVFLTQNTTVYAILGIVSLTLAFSLIQRNYTTAAIFITLSIIFIYALLQPEVLKVIQFRIFDTLIGAGLAAAGNLILWPKWESQSIKNVIALSVNANSGYLTEIDEYYQTKKRLSTSYKLARKKAFLEMGNLSGAFQRMTQEPKFKQSNVSLIYEIVGLNQTFLSALASLGTYIRTHPTTEASSDFDSYTNAILTNLKTARHILENKPAIYIKTGNIEKAGKSLHQKFDKLAEERDIQIKEGKTEIDRSMRLRLQEAHLVAGQLEWLQDISHKLLKNLQKLNRIENE